MLRDAHSIDVEVGSSGRGHSPSRRSFLGGINSRFYAPTGTFFHSILRCGGGAGGVNLHGLSVYIRLSPPHFSPAPTSLSLFISVLRLKWFYPPRNLSKDKF